MPFLRTLTGSLVRRVTLTANKRMRIRLPVGRLEFPAEFVEILRQNFIKKIYWRVIDA